MTLARPTLLATGFALVATLAQADAVAFGDPENGARLYNQCSACHAIGDSSENRIGPHLNGVFDRRAGSIELQRGVARQLAA